MEGQSQTELPLPASGRVSLRAELHPAEAVLRGRVLDGSGTPVLGARVMVAGGDGSALATAESDASGAYQVRITGVSSGTYSLAVERKGYHPLSGLAVSAQVKRGEGLPTGRLVPKATTFSGMVSAVDGSAQAGFVVQVRGPQGEIISETMTDAAGNYRMNTEVPSGGKVIVQTSRPGWSQAMAEVTDVTAGWVSRDMVVMPLAVILEGRVLGEDGAPMPSVEVELLEEGHGIAQFARADRLGHYEFRDVVAKGLGWYTLWIRPKHGTFGGSITHQSDIVPLVRPVAGVTMVIDLLVN